MVQKTKFWIEMNKDYSGFEFARAYLSQTSNSTPGPNGRPDLRAQNPFFLYNPVTTVFEQYPHADEAGDNVGAWLPMTAGGMSPPPNLDWTSVDNTALAKWNGKLRKGGASMGVNLASWKQSRDMIIHRSKSIGNTLDRAWSRLSKDERERKRLIKQKEPLANQILEGEFGWKPALQDIHACMYTVCQEGVPPNWVGSRHTATVTHEYESAPGSFPYFERKKWRGEITTRLSGNVQITNPNLWLLNRLGLINPATVIWDLVPWSFLVNMFVNVNAMINSVSDRVGVNVTNMSTTRSMFFTCEHTCFSVNSDGSPAAYPGPAHSVNTLRQKDRAVGDFPAVQWEVKVPKLDWELAAIASSLLLQKAQRLNKLVSLI
jgi:hypothetical protein